MKNHPRILIGALRGGSGKTLLSLSLLAAWRKQGDRLAVFKKGPDYIDSAWLSQACGSACYNLDTYLMGDLAVCRSFAGRARQADLSLVEGNRGLFDGVGVEGSHSSAELAKKLGLCVFLVVDCRKSTRTLAALLKGCQVFDPGCMIQGVVLNQVANSRHESVVRGSIEKYCGIPVFGAIPPLAEWNLPERHLGLLPPAEHDSVEHTLGTLQNLVRRYVDLEAVKRKACEAADSLPWPELESTAEAVSAQSAGFSGLRLGVFQDGSFHFYYPENLEAFTNRGAKIVPVKPAEDPCLPAVDALYIGGGFPEAHAGALADNVSFRESLRRAVERGLPVYAECGGAVYLGRGLVLGDRFYPYAGVFPATYRLYGTPRGHGYTLLRVEAENPFFERGTLLRGHEFHYAGLEPWEQGSARFVCRVERGYGFDGVHEGLCYRNAYASFSHLHAGGESCWADRFLTRAAHTVCEERM